MLNVLLNKQISIQIIALHMIILFTITIFNFIFIKWFSDLINIILLLDITSCTALLNAAR